MKVGIIRYPGSNCDNDMLRYFNNNNNEVFYIWHKTNQLFNMLELLIIPGGFAFGDRYYETATSEYVECPGKMAIESPVTEIILHAVKKNIPIFGVCNGFQILTKLNLLPGRLELNNDKKFTCKNVRCVLSSSYSENNKDEILYLQVANSYGNYKVDPNILQKMIENDQIILRYDDSEYNNGSDLNIAGICDKNKLIFGMMPHPERTFDTTIKYFLNKIVKHNKNNDYFKKQINDLMHSEHISYKSTSKYLSQLYTKGSHVIQGPGENAGIIDLGYGYGLAMRIESHNHPTFIDPFQGSATGVGGILRDIFTMGAKPIAILDFLRFGTDENSKKLLKSTIKGISYYGNCFGVANVGGDLYTSNIYDKNPLVNVACLGIVKKDNIIYGNALYDKSIFIYVGSKTGNDGMNGACMASNVFSSDIDIDSMKKNIQKGDPFLERLLLEACCEITDKGILEGMQDMGAGGLLCSSLELLQRGIKKTGKNLGCVMYVDNIPTKYEMNPCERLISESQERMLLVINPIHKNTVFNIFKKWDLEYSVVGMVNMSGYYSVINSKNDVLYSEKISNFKNIRQDWDEKRISNNNVVIKKIRDKTLWQQYDTTIGGRTIKGPQDNGNYSILDIYEINKHILITWGETVDECLYYVRIINDINSKNSNNTNNIFNLYLSAIPKAIVNCLNFGNPQDTMGDFADTVDKLRKDCEKYKIPVVGGNVSLYNATDDVSIKPTPILLMVSILLNKSK